jgi:GrpB-like predicted nucleotidyltransferase (UPF0157 family)
MPAKSIVDVLAVVEDLAASTELIPVFESHGYEHRPTDDVEERHFLVRGPRSNRTHYLSLAERGSDTVEEQLAFREYLRANPEVAAKYASLKRRLAAEFPDDRESYTAAKSEFVSEILDRISDEESPTPG